MPELSPSLVGRRVRLWMMRRVTRVGGTKANPKTSVVLNQWQVDGVLVSFDWDTIRVQEGETVSTYRAAELSAWRCLD